MLARDGREDTILSATEFALLQPMILRPREMTCTRHHRTTKEAAHDRDGVFLLDVNNALGVQSEVAQTLQL